MKVLIPIQDSVFGEPIIDMVIRHRWPADTEFKLLNVVEYGTYGEMLGELYCCDATQSMYAERQAAGKKLLEQFAGRLDAVMPGMAVLEEVAVGEPKEVILRCAEQWSADMIVMGSHSRKGLTRFLLGSVSMAVLSHAPCSVIIVKMPQPAAGTSGTDRSQQKLAPLAK